MNIEDYVDRECKKIAKMANKQLLRPNRKIYIAWAFRQFIFKYLTKEALQRFEPYWPDDYYHNEIIIVNENSGHTTFYTKYNELLNEYSRHQEYLQYAEMSFEQHLKNAFLHKVNRGIEYNLRQVLTERRPHYSFKEYDRANLSINCYALTLIHDGKFHMPIDRLMKYFRDSASAHWYVIEPCSTFMKKDTSFELEIKLIRNHVYFRTDTNTYVIGFDDYPINSQSKLNIRISDNSNPPELEGVVMNEDGLLVYEMVHYNEKDSPITIWTVNENTASKPDPFAFYGLDKNGQ
ncbi:hypothetical protein EJ576_21885 [Pseudomonas sp. C 49-2]|uniref:hypothetical protein n=1 Tax=Pseudomonas sp. C 49-2 TaxID=2496849 RepID=UPI000F82EE8A|nr:hypothetical protein [Pseudomonas sp. C 49-2]RTX96379.1 hypothetical protein EJ576_21885 [Pseudomonas sp. C 49-2]